MDEEKDVSVSEQEVPEAEAAVEEAAEAEAADDNAVADDAGEDVSAEADPSAEDADSEPASGDASEEDADSEPASGDVSEEDAEAAMLKMLEELPDDQPGATADDIDFHSAEVSNAEFQQLSEPAGKTTDRGIELLMDVNLPVSIELGRTKMAISDILALGPGSVVELNKLAGEPVDLLVNYKIVARGEVVVIDENFGVRITQLLNPEERLRILGEQ